MKKWIIVLGYLASLILMLGAIFANRGFVAGKVLFLVGFLAFNFGYLVPLFYVIFKENQENKIGLFITLGILGFLTFLTGISFYSVSWGGGIVLIYVGGSILLAAIIIMILVSRRFYETSIYSWFPVLVFGVFIVVSLLASTVNRQVMRVFSLNNNDAAVLQKHLFQKNLLVYNTIKNKSQDAVLMDSLLSLVDTVYIKSNSLINYIQKLKIELINEVEGEKHSFFESRGFENLFPIQSNVEINGVKKYMLKKERKAYELKKELVLYNEFLKSIVTKTDTLTIKSIDIYINTESSKLSRHTYNKSWELQNFYDFPLVTVIDKLTHMQNNVALIENEMLLYFYLNMN